MIIGISGKKGHGKDLVGNIIRYLTSVYKKGYYEGDRRYTLDQYNKQNTPTNISPFYVKKFADSLKNMICMLIGCTRKQLEDREFKEKELGEEWWRYKLHDGSVFRYVSKSHFRTNPSKNKFIEKLTPRKILQLLGTEGVRDTIHPNAWVNSLMSEYKAVGIKSFWKKGDRRASYKKEYPNWIITDMRFPNELKSVKDRKGITIRVNRDLIQDTAVRLEHESETALDNAEFDYIIYNNGSIDDLIEKVKDILIKEKIIN